MRLITHDIHRAFPELDRFGDEQCRRYLDRIRTTNAYQLSVLGGGLLGAAIGVVPAVIVVGISRAIIEVHWQPSGVRMLAGLAMIVGTIGIPAVFALIGRDHVLALFLHNCIGRTKCLGCRYSLLGQEVINDTVRCPECGARMTLDDLGLDSEEALNPRIDSKL